MNQDIGNLYSSKDTKTKLSITYNKIRSQTKLLAEKLTLEDQCVQSMPNASPTKWHLAHTTWFFETFILKIHVEEYEEYNTDFNFLFNSYYEQIGARHSRDARGVLTRPSNQEVLNYRDHVDSEMTKFIGAGLTTEQLELLTLGIHHEQQHQELILTDIKHLLSCNPTNPIYFYSNSKETFPSFDSEWIEFNGGLIDVGSNGEEFIFDCEGPRHKHWLAPYQLASRPITNGEFLEFINDGGYQRPELWLSDGWSAVRNLDWQSPLYWKKVDGTWKAFTLAGLKPIIFDAPVCHVSHFEADAYARWTGNRLPTEAEWEHAARTKRIEGNFVESEAYEPRPTYTNGLSQLYGDVWEWTTSPYVPYPGFKTAEGAVGEYNGKFMSGQMVLRGGSCVTPESHIRCTYRNFFYPQDRWQFSGFRLAKDAET